MPAALSAYLSLVAGLAVLTFSGPCLMAQSDPCPPPAALISSDNPAYADAMDLSKRLQDHGFVVRCIFPTKLGSIFEVADTDTMRSTIEGEANFATNYGGFDVIFLPKPQTFADFKITERRQGGGGYLYRFTGTPKVWAGDQFKFGTAYRNYFLKHENYLLFLSDEALRVRLEEALRPSAAP